MKANELMIDDWLQYYDCNLKKQCYAQVTSIQADGAEQFIQTSDSDVYYLVEEYKPIPLTPEILEKNGFYLGYTSNQEDAASQIHCTLPEPMWTWDEGAGSIQISFPNESDGGEMYLSDQNFDRDLHFVFCENIYVHELQHALKLCGIEKTIEP